MPYNGDYSDITKEKFMKFIIFAFLLFMPMAVQANSDPAIQAKQAENFIRDLGQDAINAMESTSGDETARRAQFKKILNNKFDMNTISRFAMGRYWAVATDSEKREYTKLFKKMIVDVYTNRFSDYSGQTITVKGAKSAGNKDFIVNSLIVGGGQPIRVDWRLRRNKVIDVIVEGVSMSVTQRSEFASIIQRGGGDVSALIDHLKK